MTDTRKDALSSLALFAKGIIPTRFNAHDFEPTQEDSISMQNDLLILAEKVDKVILAYGEYLLANGIINENEVQDHFHKVLESALEGNATWAIEKGFKERIEERAA